jgi:hypothetical protein
MPISRHIPAKGEGEIVEFSVPSPFEEDTLVSSIEVLPGDPAVVHHVLVQTQTQSKFLATPNPPRCSDCIPKASGPPRGGGAYSSRPSPNVPRFTENDDIAPVRDDTFTTMEAVYAPGGAPLDLRATNSATLIPGGKPIRIEMHYTPNGKETSDQTKIGFTLATDAMSRRFVIMAPEHLGDTGKPIPANDGNWETTGELTFQKNAELAWFMPHMHLRGKDMKFQLLYPNGGLETVLDARFKFNWQLGYELEYPLEVKRGTRMIVTAHHDNSANNPANPAPDQSVGWGELTSQEMMLPWFGVIVTGDARPDQIASYKVGR